MTFVSGYRMIINLFKLEQFYNSILCNTMLLSLTFIIVSKMIEYDNPWHPEEGAQSSRLWCINVSLPLSHWYPGSGVALDCIDSFFVHPCLL